VLELQGFDVVEDSLAVPVPRNVPGVAPALNAVVPEIPVIRFSSALQVLAARLRVPRPPLSCSVIIPCHNEEANIEECVRRVPDMGAWTEIIAVDDGSTDGTRAAIERAMKTDRRVRLVAFDRNQGKANAVMAGFDAARGEVLFILDADMAVTPEELPRFLQPLQEGRADFINGTRLVYPMEGKAMKIANFLGNKGFCYLTSAVLRQRVSDTLCGTKVFFKRDFLRMPIDGTERWGDFDLLFGAARLRLRILEIPVHYQERRAGVSKMRVVKDGFLFLNSCLNGWRKLRLHHPDSWTSKRQAPTPSVVLDGARQLEVAGEEALRQALAGGTTPHNGTRPAVRE
jgi:glycosyl transferase family 2